MYKNFKPLHYIIILAFALSGCAAVSVFNPFVSGKGSLNGYTYFINLKNLDGIYVRLSNNKTSFILPLKNNEEFKNENLFAGSVKTPYMLTLNNNNKFSKENISAGSYDLYLVKKNVMKNCGKIIIKADSTALLRIYSSGDQFEKMDEIRTEVYYIGKRPFTERGSIEGKVTSPPPPYSYGALIDISQYPLWNATVDSSGYFRIDNILPGTYDLSIFPFEIGFATSAVRNIKVKNKKTTNIETFFLSEWILPVEMPSKPRKEEYKKGERK
jgi:hypothetical protein